MAGGFNMPPTGALGQNLGGSTASSNGTTLTGGAINTKGSWTQLSSASSGDITRLVLCIDMLNLGGNQGVLDLAAAAAGSESSGIIIQNLVISANGDVAYHIELPVLIKSGTAITMRVGSPTATDTIQVSAVGYDTGYTEALMCGTYDTYGYSGTGTITGISVDPGAVANTKGAYVAMTASSTNDLAGFFLGFDDQNHNTTTSSETAPALFDVAIGGAGSEVVIMPNIAVSRNNFTTGLAFGPHFSPIFWLPIKAATRIAVRSQSATAVATDRLFGVSLYGVRA